MCGGLWRNSRRPSRTNLALMMLDWALIILSSLIGANLVSQALPLDQATTVLLAILLAISGIVIQSRLLQRAAVLA
jgi:hypothetical protein